MLTVPQACKFESIMTSAQQIFHMQTSFIGQYNNVFTTLSCEIQMRWECYNSHCLVDPILVTALNITQEPNFGKMKLCHFTSSSGLIYRNTIRAVLTLSVAFTDPQRWVQRWTTMRKVSLPFFCYLFVFYICLCLCYIAYFITV